jgi:hypothetical protein
LPTKGARLATNAAHRTMIATMIAIPRSLRAEGWGWGAVIGGLLGQQARPCPPPGLQRLKISNCECSR